MWTAAFITKPVGLSPAAVGSTPAGHRQHVRLCLGQHEADGRLAHVGVLQEGELGQLAAPGVVVELESITLSFSLLGQLALRGAPQQGLGLPGPLQSSRPASCGESSLSGRLIFIILSLPSEMLLVFV